MKYFLQKNSTRMFDRNLYFKEKIIDLNDIVIFGENVIVSKILPKIPICKKWQCLSKIRLSEHFYF